MATKALTWKDNENKLRRRIVHRLRLGSKTVAIVSEERGKGWKAIGFRNGAAAWAEEGRYLEQMKSAAMAWARAAYNVKEGADL